MKRHEFLRQIGLLSGGTMLSMGGIQLNAMAQSPFKLSVEETAGKILVLLQLQGGNDGLNTVVPYEDSKYYNARKTVNIKKEDALKLTNTLGLHPSMVGLKNLYDNDKLAIVQNVGYAQPDRSHFRSTDIWLSASDSKQQIFDGWLARYLENQNPGYPAALPTEPMAIQLGSVESMLLQGKFGSLGTVFEDPNLFYQLISGSKVDNDPPPNTIAGDELKFLRQVASASIQYSEAIKTKADLGKNTQTYPNSNLGRQLAIVSKLIAGGLTTPVYLTTLNGFDTHANQLTQHANLWKTASEAIAIFQKDIEAQGLADKVVLMTVSEFGRRLTENATSGTDHGAPAPMFVIGKNVKGGIIGANPNLNNLDGNGDFKFEFDYRQLYTSVIQDHFGSSAAISKEILNRDFTKLPIFKTNNTVETGDSTIGISQNYPNPARGITTIDYYTTQNQQITIKIFDLQGRQVAVLKDELHASGNYKAIFNTQELPQGMYAYNILAANGDQKTLRMIVAGY
jgi:uncharacterized protein (DUF1501 family)